MQPTFSSRQRGFSLVELMVSMVISLLVVLAATATGVFFMSAQRQATGVGSATANAISAIQAVKYEAAQAGLGFSLGGYMPCTTLNLAIDTNVISDGAAFAPISVATSGVRSTVTLAYGTALEGATPVLTRNDQTSEDTDFELSTYLPVVVANTPAVMIAPPVGVTAPCTVRTVTDMTAPVGTTGYVLKFGNTGVHNKVMEFTTKVDYADSSQVFLLEKLRRTVFTLNDNNDLVMTRPFDPASPSAALAHNIVAFLVQYGATDGVNPTLQPWQDPTGTWAAPSALQISRVHALRIGVVARASQRQKPAADGSCDATTEQPTLMGQTLALTGDWQCFKYRSFTSVVPLRNMVLGSSV
jgi:type IV pilus assembly protein PilW